MRGPSWSWTSCQRQEERMGKRESLVARGLRQLPDLDRLEQHLGDAPDEWVKSRLPGRTGPAEEGLEGLSPHGDVEIGETGQAELSQLMPAGRRAVQKLKAEGESADLTPPEARGLEAIIVLTGRPAILIQDGHFMAPPEEWKQLVASRAEIEAMFPSVGRIEVPGHPEVEWLGTGFLVADDVVLTNRHVAVEFCRAKGKEWVFEPGIKPRIDYKEELNTSGAAEFSITGIIGVHDKIDMALFRVS